MKLVCLIFFAIAIFGRLDAFPADPALPKVPEKATPDPSALSKTINNSHIPDPTDAISKMKGAGSPGADIAKQIIKGGEAIMAIPVVVGKNIMEGVGKIFNPGALAKDAPSVPDANATKAVAPPSKLPESSSKAGSFVSAATTLEKGVEDMFGGFGL